MTEHCSPCPKPVPEPKKPRQFGSSLPIATKPVKAHNAEREAAEFARCFGSEERVKWFQRMGCCICGATPSDNAHTRGDGGSRRADACWIVPLCRRHHTTGVDSIHNIGRESFEAAFSIDLDATAAEFHARWLASSPQPETDA